jgi:hypothetical protein
VSQKRQATFVISIDRSTLLPESFQRIGFTSIELPEIPAEVRQVKTANYNDDAIVSRSEPWKAYGYSNATVFDFTVKLVATGQSLRDRRSGVSDVTQPGLGITPRYVSQSGEGSTENLERRLSGTRPEDIAAIVFREVHSPARWLEALTYPQYDDQGRGYPPPVVHLSFGQNFVRRGILRSVSLSYMGPWEPRTLLCHRIDAMIQFEEANRVPRGFVDVVTGFGDDTAVQPVSAFNQATRLRTSSRGLARSQQL